MTPLTKQRFDKVNELIAKGIAAKDAVKQIGWTLPAYYGSKSALKRGKKRPYRKRQKLTVQDLPEVKTDHGKVFMLYGDPATLLTMMGQLQ